MIVLLTNFYLVFYIKICIMVFTLDDKIQRTPRVNFYTGVNQLGCLNSFCRQSRVQRKILKLFVYRYVRSDDYDSSVTEQQICML